MNQPPDQPVSRSARLYQRALEVIRESVDAFPRELLLRVSLIETLLVIEMLEDSPAARRWSSTRSWPPSSNRTRS